MRRLSDWSATDWLSALTRFNGTVQRAVAYGSHARQRLDIYLPPARSAARSERLRNTTAENELTTPTVLFFYGGSWNRGSRSDYAFVGKALAKRGITTLIADYRLYPEVRYPAFLHDCALAADWTFRNRAQWGGDLHELYVMGHSAGAYNAAMLALDARWLGEFSRTPSQWAGWIGLAGPYEFLPITVPDAQPVFEHPHYPAGTQPIDYVSAASPRTLLLSANRDNMIDPVRNSQALANRLHNAGVKVTYRSFDLVDHQTLIAALASPLSWMAPVSASIARFVFDRPTGSA